MLGEFYIGYGFIRGRFAGIYYDILGAGLWSPKGVAESPEGDSLHAYPAWGYFSVKKSNQKSLGEDPETPDASEPSRPETLRIPGAGLDDADKVPQAHINLVSVESKIKCAAGTLRAYLRRRTDDAFASFVSSRSLAARGSWGTAPSVFWHGAPGGTQGPLGKGGAAERWRVAYPIGIATRHGAKPATTRTHKRNATAASRTGCHSPVTPRRR